MVLPLTVLAMFRVLMFVDRQWIVEIRNSWLVIPALVLPELCLLLYPVWLARRRGFGKIFRPPPLTHWIWESMIATPIAALVIVLYFSLAYLISLVSPESLIYPEQIGTPHNVYITLLTLVTTFTLAPVSEEVFFRGFLHNALRARMPLVIAAILQSLIFAGLHRYDVFQTGTVFVAGLVFTAVYEWRKSLLAPIFMHASFNFVFAALIAWMMFAAAQTPVLGVSGEDHPEGCLVTQVGPDTAAEKAGIAPGDIVTDFDGYQVAGFRDLAETVRSYEIGDVVVVGVLREDAYLEIEVTLRRRR